MRDIAKEQQLRRTSNWIFGSMQFYNTLRFEITKSKLRFQIELAFKHYDKLVDQELAKVQHEWKW